MKTPKTLADLQRLLGIANYSRTYIPKYAELVKPLYDLMDLENVPENCKKKNGAANGKKIVIEWNDGAMDALHKLIDIMCSELVLALPNFDLDFKVTSDASDLGYGAVLEQEMTQADRSIGYFSKCYTKAQKNYSTSEKELLGIVMAVEHWSSYLYGKKFIIYSDHKPLAWLLNKKSPHPRVERWIIRLAIYEFEIRYKPGRENIVADMLSRLFDENDVNENPEDDYFDVLVAAVEYEPSQDEDDAHIDHQYLEELVLLPSSNQARNKTAQDQDQDEEIKWLKDLIVQHGTEKPKVTEFNNTEQRVFYKEYSNFQLIDNILYRQAEDQFGINQIQLVLPKKAIEEVLDKVHCLVYSGHLGRRKTYKTMSQRFYRPFLGKHVEKYVQSCDICQKIKSLGQPKRAELKIITPSRTNELVATDMAGPFKPTVRGNRYFEIINDCYSKF